jgi:hypothetical protein
MPMQGSRGHLSSAWMAHAEGKAEDALQLMRAAAALEDASEKHIAMENWLVPMRELLGELLLDLSQSSETLREFEASLRGAPNRFRSFYGAGEPQRSKIFYEQ